jgi:cyclic pyranopterin phosphate synthase
VTSETVAPETALADAQGRRISYLRLSLTDRCNFSCSYCAPTLPDRNGDPRSGCEPLSRAAIARLVRVFAQLGVRRVRLTGGEPTLRRDLIDVVRDVRATPGIEEVALTTNGHLLSALAAPLREAGVSRLNVSLDTLDPDKLRRISGSGASLERIVTGLERALRAGFASVKLNVVVVAGTNEAELGNLVRFGWRAGATVRFIELMPFGIGRPVPTAEVKRLLEAQGVILEPDASRGWGPAYHMRGSSTVDGKAVSGLVGFIGAMTESFCEGCNRVRVAADGSLRPCLGGRDRVALAGLLASDAPDEAIGARIRAALLAKGERHRMQDEAPAALLPMLGTGG